MDRGGERGETVARLRMHMAELPGGLGCRHLARERDGVDATLLVNLGLVRPIMSRVPRCCEHGCPWLPRCDHWPDFEPEATGHKAGVKYRPTPAGLVAATDERVIEGAVRELPVVADLISWLESGPATVFVLYARLLDARRAAVRAGRGMDDGPTKVALGAVLEVLVGLEWLRRGEDGVTYALVAR